MTKSIQAVLSPLRTISYVCGLRIFQLPASDLRSWYGFLYNVLLWSVYCFFLVKHVIPYIPTECKEYLLCTWLKIVTTLLSVLIGIYNDEKFRNCLKMITIVDDTLEPLGITTDYQKLSTKIMWFVSIWTVTVLFLNYGESIWWQGLYNVIVGTYVPLLLNYCNYINIIDDLIFAGTIGYIGLKFDQVNEHLRKLMDDKSKNNEREIKQAWENSVLYSDQRKYHHALSSDDIIWIIIHLHLELCKISRKIDSIFGIQITLKMTSYFCFMAELLHELFDMFFLKTYKRSYKPAYIAVCVLWFVLVISNLLVIHCICEKVSAKANATGNFINRVSFSSACNMETRENILQFSLQIIRAPLKFCGFGLFQFGLKFLHGYSESILTFLVILVQTKANKYLFVNNFG